MLLFFLLSLRAGVSCGSVRYWPSAMAGVDKARLLQVVDWKLIPPSSVLLPGLDGLK
jgi:hypothetical protein